MRWRGLRRVSRVIIVVVTLATIAIALILGQPNRAHAPSHTPSPIPTRTCVIEGTPAAAYQCAGT